MPEIRWEIDNEPPPFPKKPEGGWNKACGLDDHKWDLVVEDGKASLNCRDPHSEEFCGLVDPNGPPPVCGYPYWVQEDIYIESIPVKVKHVDDSTPSTPAGPAEYGFYLEIEVDADALSQEQRP